MTRHKEERICYSTFTASPCKPDDKPQVTFFLLPSPHSRFYIWKDECNATRATMSTTFLPPYTLQIRCCERILILSCCCSSSRHNVYSPFKKWTRPFNQLSPSLLFSRLPVPVHRHPFYLSMHFFQSLCLSLFLSCLRCVRVNECTVQLKRENF